MISMINKDKSMTVGEASSIAFALFHTVGSTISSDNSDLPTEGFYVARKGGLEVDGHHTKDEVLAWVCTDYSNNGSTRFYGTWVCGNTKCYDASLHFKYLDEAIEFGKENNQIAIWDIANSKEIILSLV